MIDQTSETDDDIISYCSELDEKEGDEGTPASGFESPDKLARMVQTA